MPEPLYNLTLDDFLQLSGLGSNKKALTNMLYGLNHARVRPGVKGNKSTYGWTFFVRPQLNLRSYNLRNIRAFYPLLTKNELSIQRYIRVMLDPRLPYDLYINGNSDDFYSKEKIFCPLVDYKNPFIPILTNAIKTMSGWPDEVVPTYTTTQGMRREQASMIDGTYEILETFDLNVTFENYVNDPIFMLFQVWIRYASLVFEGMMEPYWDFVMENEFDYNTRIYRITTDETWENINYIAATGAAFPISVPSGKFFDFAKDKPYSDQTKEINIRFKCMGAIYNDDILIREFNLTNAIFNPEYKAYLQGEDTMEVIPKELQPIMNFRGYPYIDPVEYKIKWLIPKTSKIYAKMTKLKDKDIDELYAKNNEKATNNDTNLTATNNNNLTINDDLII
jgi:hypothetical protein